LQRVVEGLAILRDVIEGKASESGN
jgi:hypothetical protein